MVCSCKKCAQETGKGIMVPFNEGFIQCKILYEMGVYLQCQYAISSLFFGYRWWSRRRNGKGAIKKVLEREREMRGDRCHLEFHVLSSKMKVWWWKMEMTWQVVRCALCLERFQNPNQRPHGICSHLHNFMVLERERGGLTHEATNAIVAELAEKAKLLFTHKERKGHG